MNSTVLLDACRRMSFRECQKLYSVSQKTWQYARTFGELPPDGRGRPVNTALTDKILETVREHPEYSYIRLAFECGCSEVKVRKVLSENKLNLLWQRLRYAGVDNKELDPDLVNARKKENRIKADGPGALVHIDAKRYGALEGGLVAVAMTVVDNFSGFTWMHFCPDGRKTGENSAAALSHFAEQFPASFRRLYSDNGTEFVNSKVAEWCANNGVTHKTTKVAHAWSNGKAERTQSMLKREVFIPALLEKQYPSIAELQEGINPRLVWYNTERPHFGLNNQGLPPSIVAKECAGLSEAERDEKLAELRKSMRHENRRAWEKDQAESE